MNMMNKNVRIALIILVSLFCISGFYAGFVGINMFFETHYFQFNKVISVILKPPFEVKTRVPKIVTEKIVLDYPHQVDTPIKKYICDKFGPYDCKTALAIVAAESNFNDQAIGINKNGTVDLGCWQINSIHIKSGSIKAADTFDCYKATDWAYNKFKKDGGWGAWVTYNNGSYLIKMESN